MADIKSPPRKLRYSERWVRDGVDVCHVPAYSITVEADMTGIRAALEAAKSRGLHPTYSHVMVRAAALALAGNPELHQMVCGNRRHNPAEVDIALSIAGDTAVAPLMVIRDAGRKSIAEIADEVANRAPAVRKADKAMMQALDRWGFLVPFSFLRRIVLRALFRSVRFRRNGAGTFQVTVLQSVDQFSSPVFSASALLQVGSVREKSIVYQGNIAIRSMVTLTCCADHRIWDGRAGELFLKLVKDILESDSILAEIAEIHSGEPRQAVAPAIRK